ncbi:MAG: hypothetical protein WA093_04415 [Minisyncoccales bacterium]
MEKQNNQNNNSVDYRELVDFLVGQFDKSNERFDRIEKILEAKADRADIDRVLTRIAMINTKIDDYRAEQIATQRQVDKHEKILCKL